ncbi:MAG: 2-polyprenyl-3-methyl-6-methoxy-1,4-benzoquinone monooxygenase [Porticoccaceae bacterium]|nr:2-polyprenyl-3-methyl-6-methoxy-1,4-benzoquinone monooxygenase [Porticoccaceae bacterium]
MTERRLTAFDHLISSADRALRTLTADSNRAQRPSPGLGTANAFALSEPERNHAAGLMRVNHSGEVCAQALYQGQALTAKLPQVREEMEQAAEEEVDHLAWCETRLKELDSQPSVLNPLWYAMSFGIGAGAGLVSDRLSLGFVAATEELVCQHLSDHLESLPPQDDKSRAIVEQMLEDEAKHAASALASGGMAFPAPVKGLMRLMSKAMTKTSYRI